MPSDHQVLISPLKAVSVTNQADLIKKLIEAKGYGVLYKSCISMFDIRKEQNRAFLWFNLALIRFLGDAIPPYLYCKKPKAVYVTVEGIPCKGNILHSPLHRLELIANSEFTKSCLERAGLNVIDVVHHAVDWDRCQRLRRDSEKIRAKWESEFGSRVKLLYVGRNDPRKGLDRLDKALNIVNERMKERVVCLLFTEGNLQNLEAKPNVLRIGSVNSLDYDQVLRLMGACDYLVFPSMAEGFGMPLLEANAMGRPAIHAWIPPLSEFSSKVFNFVFGYQSETLVNNANRQLWIFHEYRPEKLAEIIMDAVKIYQDSKSEYEQYCKQAAEHSRNWDYRKVYPAILKRLKL